MKEKLAMLYNTLCQIETRGVSTKIMAECLAFLENIMDESDKDN